MKRLERHLIIVVLALASSAALRGQTYEAFHQFELPGPMQPNGLIQDSDGNFYGTSTFGGRTDLCDDGCGTVFKIDETGVVTILHEFTGGEEGFYPVVGVLRASNGDLYGTTGFGGSSACTAGCGTVFRIDSNGTFTTVHTFEITDGSEPLSGLIEPQPGDLWGTTLLGGDLTCAPEGCGTIYRMHFNGDLETMHTFTFNNGENAGSEPFGNLLLADDGNLYGTTQGGGIIAGLSTAFQITLNGHLTKIHDFDGVTRSLIQADSGDLIGTIQGVNTPDRVYRMTFDGDVEILHTLASDGSEGTTPQGPPLQADDGFFYGTTNNGGGNNRGTVFQLGTDGNLTVIHSFETGAEGRPSYREGLIQAADRRLYGTTNGDIGHGGVAYRILLPGTPIRYYCPTEFVRRDQMAAFLLKIEHGAGYVPPACSSQFPDVACPGLFANWIEQLAAEGITAGCGGGNYCPLSPVTRAQMAVFLLKTEHGAAYTPPDCAGTFPDVLCPSTFADWIEQLAAEGITSGCGQGNFCPDSPVTRSQMAVFLLKIEHGSAFAPPACQYVFTDVACPSQFANWVEALYAEGFTAGCAGP